MDFATSASPAVQAQLDRLITLPPGTDMLGLSRITTLLDRIGNPHRRLPPVFHVAGTNGKGSTCAFLRAALEAEGHSVHSYTSPHLVRFNERIRIAGRLIDDDALADLLARVLDRAEGIGASFFEVTTAAAFLTFSDVAADACVIEVGLGGRLDATNVIVDPAACGIAQLGIDHQAFLGSSAPGIAREKAGIAKAGRPMMTLAYPPDVAAAVAKVAADEAAILHPAPQAWQVIGGDRIAYRDSAGTLELPAPTLAGAHQHINFGLAVAMLRHQDRVFVSNASLMAAATGVRWPARMQRLAAGPLTRSLASGLPIWLDGGHNPGAAIAIAGALTNLLDGGTAHLIVGMLANKDAAEFLAPLAPLAASLTAVPIPGHDHYLPNDLAAIAADLGIAGTTAPDLTNAITAITRLPARPLVILGSLYLAGIALAANDEAPD